MNVCKNYTYGLIDWMPNKKERELIKYGMALADVIMVWNALQF